ncbi:MAG TPA: Clp protease N-terminal domain-containing protein, partial [Microlunatus sp.]|nr:Clp protease N-terminal domain-containing protein [Microlunatus sp.]
TSTLPASLHGRRVGCGTPRAGALAALGIDLAAVRRQADAAFGAGALDRPRATPRRGHLPFTREAKATLELALREAVRTKAATIGGGQLLLGLLRVPDAVAGQALGRALQQAGSGPAALRTALEHPQAQAG